MRQRRRQLSRRRCQLSGEASARHHLSGSGSLRAPGGPPPHCLPAFAFSLASSCFFRLALMPCFLVPSCSRERGAGARVSPGREFLRKEWRRCPASWCRHAVGRWREWGAGVRFGGIWSWEEYRGRAHTTGHTLAPEGRPKARSDLPSMQPRLNHMPMVDLALPAAMACGSAKCMQLIAPTHTTAR